jgi:hypothetical protein
MVIGGWWLVDGGRWTVDGDRFVKWLDGSAVGEWIGDR